VEIDCLVRSLSRFEFPNESSIARQCKIPDPSIAVDWLGAFHIESSTSGGQYINVHVPHSCYDSVSQAYDLLLLKLENHVTNPNLTPILLNAVGSNPLNNEVLAVIGFGATSEGGFGSTGRLQEVSINHIDYETCNDMYDGDIVGCVMLCAGVLAAVKIVAKATPVVPFSSGAVSKTAL
jgi:hypothetical protein